MPAHKLTKEEFIRRAKLVQSNPFDYSKVNYNYYSYSYISIGVRVIE